RNVVPHDLEARIVTQRRNVLPSAGEIVVYAKNLVAVVQKSLAEVRSEEPRAAGHEHALAHQRSSDLYDRRRMAGRSFCGMPGTSEGRRWESRRLAVLGLGRSQAHATIGVDDADDIVLSEISAGLHLDEVQRNLAGVFQPVDGAQGYVSRLVFMQ